MSVRNLESLFQPASVAVIGASDRPGSVGQVIWRNLVDGGFKGSLWPVNQRQDTVGGARAWPDVATLPQAPALAVICTPAASVPGLIAQLGARGTRAAIVVTAGLKQPAQQGAAGTGRTLEQAMLDAARPWLLRILGPNCLGLLVPGLGLNASFAPGNAQAGTLAFATQSGALATAMLDWANSRALGFSHFISMGDSADVDFGDVLDYLGSDPHTRAILLYIESVKHARKFMSAARAAARNKPVIVVKAGRAPEGARAAASHTGALAGSDTVFDAAVHRAGMLRVHTLDALFDAAETLARVRAPMGPRLALLTNGGGAGVLAADALALGGGTLAVLGADTLAELDACLPATWPRANPVDIIGDAPVERYADALRVLLAAPEVDGVLFMHAPTAIVPAGAIAQACLAQMQGATRPVLTCWLGGAVVQAARMACAQAGVAGYDTPERAVAGWLQLTTWAHNQAALRQLPDATLSDFTPDLAAARALVAAALEQGREWLDEAQAKALLQAYGVPVVRTMKVQGVDAAVQAAQDIGFPVALKVVSPQILHKSDVGGVVLGLASADDVRVAATSMLQRLAQQRPDAVIEAFTVQAMAQRPGAHELIVGIASDAVFGPVVLFGEGGTAVELRRDRAIALPPLNDALAHDLIGKTQVARLLAGYRGKPAADMAALVGTLLRVSQMACDLPELAELDINPLLADAQGVVALDARIRVRRCAPGEPSRLAVRPYPAGLAQTVQLQGQVLQVRPIRPEDGERLKAFYAAASPEDLRLRFFSSRREVPLTELARYSQIDYDRDMTFIALDSAGAMAGEVRAVCDPDNISAEFAIHVAGPWQGKGLGRQLLDKLIAYVRSRGTQELVGQCLEQNEGMAALARRCGFEVDVVPSADTLSLRLKL
jgi:acetyltransferase